MERLKTSDIDRQGKGDRSSLVACARSQEKGVIMGDYELWEYAGDYLEEDDSGHVILPMHRKDDPSQNADGVFQLVSARPWKETKGE